jgi:hypothetical protein
MNIASAYVSVSRHSKESYLKFSLQFPAGHTEQPSNGFYSIISARVVVSNSFPLHYFLAPSENFLIKELSRNFAPISGGAHGTTFERLLLPQICSNRIKTWFNRTG